jgi:hypothetical protein
MVLRASKNIPQRMDETRQSELPMFMAVGAPAATAAPSGPRWRCPPVPDDSSGRPTRARGPPRGPHSGLRAALKERHMRRLAVALALTLPMMVALARSALAAKPTHPPADALYALPLGTPSEPSPWSDDTNGPRTIQVAGNQGTGVDIAREGGEQTTHSKPCDFVLRDRRWGRWPGSCGPQDANR